MMAESDNCGNIIDINCKTLVKTGLTQFMIEVYGYKLSFQVRG